MRVSVEEISDLGILVRHPHRLDRSNVTREHRPTNLSISVVTLIWLT
jgi:hypothetical protein